MDAVLCIHGRGGSAEEAEHYRTLFPSCDVIGLDYQGNTPWETGPEIYGAVAGQAKACDCLILIANSIGAYFALNAGIESRISHAFFISPVVDMEKLITDMMNRAGVTEAELQEKGIIHTAFGEDLSWDYLRYAREHPVSWNVPTDILYGSGDNLTSIETMRAFARKHHAGLTVMENGPHWFHTDEQMRFLDNWIREKNRQFPGCKRER